MWGSEYQLSFTNPAFNNSNNPRSDSDTDMAVVIKHSARGLADVRQIDVDDLIKRFKKMIDDKFKEIDDKFEKINNILVELLVETVKKRKLGWAGESTAASIDKN